MKEFENTVPYNSCKAAAFYSVNEGRYLYSRNINNSITLGSVTKLLTADLALKFLSPEKIITVGTERELLPPHPSLCIIYQGHRLSMSDLLKGLLLRSGCDAAYTIAAAAARAAFPSESLSSSQAIARFVEMMNEHASSLGMTSSRFANPDGYDSPEYYTTVADTVKLLTKVVSVPLITATASISECDVIFDSGETITWNNTNLLLDKESTYYCPDAFGLKTGSTDNAGFCLAAAFKRNKKTYLSVVGGCEKKADSYRLTLKLLSELT